MIKGTTEGRSVNFACSSTSGRTASLTKEVQSGNKASQWESFPNIRF